MTDGFIGQNEVKRLDKSSDHGHSLLLPERHASDLSIKFVAYAKCIKPVCYLFFTFKIGKLILDFNILIRRQFRKKPEFLKKMADVSTPYAYPIGHAKFVCIIVVKRYAPRIIMPIADNITAKGAFPHAAIGLDKVEMALVERHLLLPHFRT